MYESIFNFIGNNITMIIFGLILIWIIAISILKLGQYKDLKQMEDMVGKAPTIEEMIDLNYDGFNYYGYTNIEDECIKCGKINTRGKMFIVYIDEYICLECYSKTSEYKNLVSYYNIGIDRK